jgi:hypothetical protein
MKTFNEPFLKEEFVNEHGEKINLVWCSIDKLFYVHHTDCNDDFDELNIFILKYTLSLEEKEILFKFCLKAIEFEKTQKLKKEN